MSNFFTKLVGGGQQRQMRYLSQALQLEEAVNPHIVLATMTMVSLAVVSFVVWAGFANINEMARAPGEVVPYGRELAVQHLEGGIIASIPVHEGEIVEKGQVLVVLSDASVKDDLARAADKQTSLGLQAERLRAFVAGRKPDFSRFGISGAAPLADQAAFFEDMRAAREKEERVVRDQIGQKKQAGEALKAQLRAARQDLALTADIVSRRTELNRNGFASDMQLLEDEKRLNSIKGDIARMESGLVSARMEKGEFESRLAALSASQRDNAQQKLDQLLSDLDQNARTVAKLEERISRLAVRAPARGIIKGLAVNTVGEVVQSGQSLMQVVPLDEGLEVLVRISPKDIGHIATGQEVRVKFSTFDFSRYGALHGLLDRISATTFAGETGERYYEGRVVLDQRYVGTDPANIILPGMTVMADIVTGDKTILEYLLRPMLAASQTAFTER